MMMKNISVAVAMMMLSGAGAQVVIHTASDSTSDSVQNRRPYLIKLGTDSDQEVVDWRDGQRLQTYAKAHDGRYIVFEVDGALYRLNDAARLREVEPAFAALMSLSKQQAALANVQRPLSDQQRALGAVQRDTKDSATQGNIGRAQGSVGRVQGEIGREQGEIGRQQGLLSVALYKRVQGMLDACLQDKSCAVAEAKHPA